MYKIAIRLKQHNRINSSALRRSDCQISVLSVRSRVSSVEKTFLLARIGYFYY